MFSFEEGYATVKSVFSPPIIAIYILAIVVITAYVIFYMILPTPTLKDIMSAPVTLREGRAVMMSDEVKKTLFGGAGGTVAAFVNAHIGDKTPKMNGAHYPLLSSEGSFSLEIAPTSIERGQTTAQLRVTMATPTGNRDETVELPNFPLQKWILVSILRDGRRFDVMYNDKIVASHRLTYYPAAPTMPLRIGSGGLLGSAVHVLVAGERVNPSLLRAERAKLADTNGAPVIPMNAYMPDGIGEAAAAVVSKFKTVCLPGLPCEAVSEPPANSMKAWMTPYA